jgi:hypothetical protein
MSNIYKLTYREDNEPTVEKYYDSLEKAKTSAEEYLNQPDVRNHNLDVNESDWLSYNIECYNYCAFLDINKIEVQ